MLPSDMGTVRHLQASGHYMSEPAPNISLAPCQQYTKSDDANICSTNVLYNRYDVLKSAATSMSPSPGSDSSHVGGAPPLHHTADYMGLPFSREWTQNTGIKTKLPPVDTLTSPSTSYSSYNIRGKPLILSLNFPISY